MIIRPINHNQSVSLHMGVCPECGRSYVAGGTTRTTTATPDKTKSTEISPELLKGLYIDEKK